MKMCAVEKLIFAMALAVYLIVVLIGGMRLKEKELAKVSIMAK